MLKINTAAQYFVYLYDCEERKLIVLVFVWRPRVSATSCPELRPIQFAIRGEKWRVIAE